MKECCKENDDLISHGDVMYHIIILGTNDITIILISGKNINDITMINIQSSELIYNENIE